ncbi:MAG TPA: hypothetical protein VFB34_04885 [Chloroflexota bacterium]|nr:hypothetical protein [Chloroflexota bacterium]
MLSKLGCLIVAVLILVAAVIIALVVYNAVNPPRPAHSSPRVTAPLVAGSGYGFATSFPDLHTFGTDPLES